MAQRATILVANMAHHHEHAGYMKAGLERHGWQVSLARANERDPTGCADMVVSWGVKQKAAWDWRKRYNRPVLVMERAPLEPRKVWTSCGFNGLAGRGVYAPMRDAGARWRSLFAQLVKPWAPRGDVAVLCGQCKGDAALWGVDFEAWAQRTCDELMNVGRVVLYRPHPFAWERGDHYCPMGATLSPPRLSLQDLAEAQGVGLVVTFNSTAGVEAALAGIPVVAYDEGSMAWAVSTRSAAAPPIRPDRTAWMHRLAWTSFSQREITAGDAWAALEEAMPCYA